MQHDPVTAPAHYTVYPVQPITITRHLGFCLGNSVKYVLRAPYKNGSEDARKALQYLEWEKETPAAPLSVRGYRQAEYAIDALVNGLAQMDGPVAPAQTAFLLHLDDYLQTGHLHILGMMREAVEVLAGMLKNGGRG